MLDYSFILRDEVLVGVFLEMYTISLSFSLVRGPVATATLLWL